MTARPHPPPAPDGPAERRRRAFHEHASLRAARNGQARRRRRRLSSTASWTAATRLPRAALVSSSSSQREIRRIGVGRIATVSGRYYAMDRDKRWERIERARDAMVDGTGEKSTDPVAAAKRSYEKGVTDEFIEPAVIVDSTQRTRRPHPRRRRLHLLQLSRRSRPRNDAGPYRSHTLKLHFTTMTQYDKSLTVRVRPVTRSSPRISWRTSWPN